MNSIRKLAIVTSLVAAFAAPSAFANLITNGDFETGTFIGSWVGGNSLTFVSSGNFDGYTQEGSYAAYFGCFFNQGLCGISQTIATTPGASYTFSFDYGSDGLTPNEFIAKFDGNTVFHTLNDVTDTRPGFIEESFTVTASGASTVVEFLGLNDVGYQALDDVSVVVPESVVPEPASLALLGIGLAGLGAMRRKQRA